MLILTTLMGCASAEDARQCSLADLNAPSGIAIDIDAAIAAQVKTTEMTVCWDGSCQTRPVTLHAGSQTVDDGCPGTKPDAVCFAREEAMAGKTGFAEIADLPARQVEVTLSLTDPAGAQIVNQTLKLTPKRVYPYGQDCGGPDGPQGRITVDADSTARPAG